MRRCWIQLLCLLLGMLAVTVAAAADEEKPAKKDKDDKPAKQDKKETKKPSAAEKQVLDKLAKATVLNGRVVRVEGAQKPLTVQIAIGIPEPTVLGTRAIGGRVVPIVGYQMRQITKDVELWPADDMKVRTLVLPQDFDEKGRPRRYTSKELRELKGPDPKLPGYTADFDSLKPDQIVKIYLARKNEAVKPPVREKPRRKKDKDDDDREPRTTEDRPEIAMIVIVTELKK